MQNENTSSATPEHRKKVSVKNHRGIFKRGSRYLVAYRHKGVQRSKYFRTLAEATRFKGQVDAGNTQTSSRRPFNKYALEWLGTYTGRTSGALAESTKAAYRDAITRCAIPYFKGVRLDEIDPPLLRGFIDHLASKGHAPATVRKYYAPVRALLATAYEDGLIRSNPALGVRVVVEDNREHRTRCLTSAQTRALLEAMPPDSIDVTLVMATTGIRIGEALSLLWADITIDGKSGPELRVRKSKTRAGIRTLTLSPETARHLALRRASTNFDDDTDPVFPNSFGELMDPHNFRRRTFKPAARRAGLEWATPHMLRHGLTTLMVASGIPTSEAAAQLGHADGGVLLHRTYAHPEPVRQLAFVDKALGLHQTNAQLRLGRPRSSQFLHSIGLHLDRGR